MIYDIKDITGKYSFMLLLTNDQSERKIQCSTDSLAGA